MTRTIKYVRKISLIGDLQRCRFLVIGASGFIGTRIAQRLVDLKAKVLGIDQRPPSIDSAMASSGRRTNCQHIVGGFEQTSSEAASFLMGVPSSDRGVFHAAGLASAGACQRSPDLAFESHVQSTFALLEMCRRIGGATIGFPSTGLVYGDGYGWPVTEEDAPRPGSLYATMKLMSEELIRFYSASRHCNAIISRLGNVYGPGASEQTVVGTILAQVARGEPLRVKDTSPIRDFIYVDDVVESFMRLFQVAESRRCLTVNVSTGIGISIDSLIGMATQLFSVPANLPPARPCRSSRVSHLVLSNDKLKQVTGWSPQTSLSQGLQESISRKRTGSQCQDL